MPALPPSPSLDDLIAHAEGFAQFSMRTGGKVPPTLLAITDAGTLFFVPRTLNDAGSKDHFANLARLICVAHAATACVLILESWMTVATPTRALDLSVAPSESLYRKEVVVVTAETGTGVKQKILPIIRTGLGGFFAFGEFEGPEPTSFTGRFAQILPPKLPTAAIRAQTRAVLDALGIHPAPDPSAN